MGLDIRKNKSKITPLHFSFSNRQMATVKDIHVK